MSTLEIVKLANDHATSDFDCGVAPLNEFISKYALHNQRSNASTTYVIANGLEILGYYTLVTGSWIYDDAPVRLAKGLPRFPIPIVLLARLAVDKRWQGNRIGESLLRDAMLKAAELTSIVGTRALVVDAKDDSARRFYERYDFVPVEGDPLRLYMLMKDLLRVVES